MLVQSNMLEGELSWVEVGRELAEHGLLCIDGRDSRCGFGAPGGTLGEIALVLSVAEWLKKAPYNTDDVRALATDLAGAIGVLRLHTDRDSVARLATRLGRPLEEMVCMVQLGPPRPLRAALLDILVEPEFTGCGHLRAMSSAPRAYRMRPRLLAELVRFGFERAWDSAHARIDLLEGEHSEEALLLFQTSELIDAGSEVPTMCQTRRYFSEHRPVLRYVRERAIRLLCDVDPGLTGFSERDIGLEVERLGQHRLDLTLSALAPELPRYEVRFGRSRVLLELS